MQEGPIAPTDDPGGPSDSSRRRRVCLSRDTLRIRSSAGWSGKLGNPANMNAWQLRMRWIAKATTINLMEHDRVPPDGGRQRPMTPFVGQSPKPDGSPMTTTAVDEAWRPIAASVPRTSRSTVAVTDRGHGRLRESQGPRGGRLRRDEPHRYPTADATLSHLDRLVVRQSSPAGRRAALPFAPRARRRARLAFRLSHRWNGPPTCPPPQPIS